MSKKRKYSTDTCTIYLLKNIINNKVYIGQTWMSLENRFGRAGRNYFNSVYLRNAINFYGYENFKYEILDICKTQEDANRLEIFYIERYDARNLDVGYNIKGGGSNGKHSPETIAKISQTLKEQATNWTPEEKASRSAPISTYWLGKERGPHTDEWKDNNSNMMKEWHANNIHPMQGKHHTEEAKNSMSEKLSENWKESHSDESIKIGAKKREMSKEKEAGIIEVYLAGKKVSDIGPMFGCKSSGVYRVIRRNNIPLRGEKGKGIGKKHSDETKNKMSESAKKRGDNFHK